MTPKNEKPMEFHPYAMLFPMAPEEDVLALSQDIKANGQLYPIILDNDSRVVDGRHRLIACRLAGVEPQFEARDLDDREALALVLSSNLHRRHLTESQRADIAAKISNTKVGGDRRSKNQKANCPSDPVVTREQAAELMNVSEKSVDRAAKVQKQGGKVLQEAVTAGDVSVSKAARIADLPKSQQPAAVKQAKAPRPRKASPLAPYDEPRPSREFDVDAASGRLTQLLRDELSRWPAEHLATAAYWIRGVLTDLKV